VNGKQYIGIAINPKRRWVEHRCGHGSKILYSAFKKYGIEKFTFSIIFEGSEQAAKDLEVHLIAHYGTIAPHGYNITAGGEGTLGWKPSKVTREKMSQQHRGKKNAMWGKKHSAETKAKIAKKAKQRRITPERLKLLQTISKGANNGRAIKVVVNGKKYGCINDAAEDLGINHHTLRNHINSKGRKLNYKHYDAKRRSKNMKGKKHTPEAIQKMKVAKKPKLGNHCMARKCLVNGHKYACIKEAAIKEKINYSTLRWRFQQYEKSGKYPPGYKLL